MPAKMNANKDPQMEAIKEVGRWVVCFLFTSLLFGIEAQMELIPEKLEVWFFIVPVREIVRLGLTGAFRYADKFKHEDSKAKVKSMGEVSKGVSYGLLPF